MTKLINSFKNFIYTQQNANIEKEEDLNITFKYDSLIFIFEYIEDDPYYYRLYLPGIFGITDNYKNWIYEKIDEYSTKFKVARLIKNGENLWAVADAFAYSLENVYQLFLRTISCLLSIYEELKKDYLNEKEKNEQN